MRASNWGQSPLGSSGWAPAGRGRRAATLGLLARLFSVLVAVAFTSCASEPATFEAQATATMVAGWGLLGLGAALLSRWPA